MQGTKEVGLWYPGNISVSLTGYSDSDFAGCKIDRKSTSGTCHLLGSSLISWQCKQLKDGIFLNQAKYCKDLLKKFEMDKCKPISTPFSTRCHLDHDEAGISVDETKYRGLIGSLLYLTASRPNIMFAVFMCARF